MHDKSLLIAVLCTVAALGQTDKSPPSAYRGPKCLANFCFRDSHLPSEKALVNRYGPGLKIGESRCYAVPDQNLYVHFDVEHDLQGEIVTVLVSDVPNCANPSKTPSPKAPFPKFETREGLKLGDAYNRVIETYGPPTSVREGKNAAWFVPGPAGEERSAQFKGRALVYDGPSDELIQGIFYIRDGRIAAFYISCSE